MNYVSWRSLVIGLSIGGLVGLATGITSTRNSYAGVAVLFLTVITVLVAFAMLFFLCSRKVGAVLFLAAFVMLAASWGVMILRGL